MQGIIKTRANPAKTSYTILLVGETGVGKSSLLELIANVLQGNDVDHYDLDTLDHTNEQSGSNNQSQPDSVHLYQFTSKNGVVVSTVIYERGEYAEPLPKVRILDTPGLVDTGDIEQDELHNRRTATHIKDHIDSITAVLVLVNGTVPRVTVGTEHALSTLSAIFPESLGSNAAFIFTNVSSPLHCNFPVGALPEVFSNAPRFLLDNPTSLQRRYLKLENLPNTTSQMAGFREEIKASEQPALEMLVDVFDWLDGLDRPKIQNKAKMLLRKVMEMGAREVRRI